MVRSRTVVGPCASTFELRRRRSGGTRRLARSLVRRTRIRDGRRSRNRGFSEFVWPRLHTLTRTRSDRSRCGRRHSSGDRWRCDFDSIGRQVVRWGRRFRSRAVFGADRIDSGRRREYGRARGRGAARVFALRDTGRRRHCHGAATRGRGRRLVNGRGRRWRRGRNRVGSRRIRLRLALLGRRVHACIRLRLNHRLL